MTTEKNKFIVGKDEFLFLGGNDANNIEDFIIGSAQISETAKCIWQNNLDNILHSNFNVSGIIVPEAHVVYRDFLSSNYSINEERPVNSITSMADGVFSYALDDLMIARQLGITVYTGDDSHWTENAALYVWLQARKRLGRSYPFKSNYLPEVGREARDLRIKYKQDAVGKSEKNLRRWQSIEAQQLLNTGILNKGLAAIFYNINAEKGRLLVFGTSFSVRLIPFYTSDFQEVVFLYGTAIDWNFVQIYNPDHIFIEMPERFVHFPAIDTDCHSISLAILARGLIGSSDTGWYSASTLPISTSPELALVKSKIDELGSALAHSKTGTTSSDLDALLDLSLILRKSPALLPIFFGNFRVDASLYVGFDAVDKSILTEKYEKFIPNNEMGLLIKTRISIRNSNLNLARQYLLKLRELRTDSREYKYYSSMLA